MCTKKLLKVYRNLHRVVECSYTGCIDCHQRCLIPLRGGKQPSGGSRSGTKFGVRGGGDLRIFLAAGAHRPPWPGAAAVRQRKLGEDEREERLSPRARVVLR